MLPSAKEAEVIAGRLLELEAAVAQASRDLATYHQELKKSYSGFEDFLIDEGPAKLLDAKQPSPLTTSVNDLTELLWDDEWLTSAMLTEMIDDGSFT